MSEGFEDLAKIGGRFTMEDITRLRLAAMLERDEGRRAWPYLDCCGKRWRECTCAVKGFLTVGVGYNLDANPIPDHVIDELRDIKVQDIEKELVTALPWVIRLDEVRYCVLLSMAFNLGVAGLLEFHRMLAAVQASNWDKAADEMRDSKWAEQVGARAARYERLMLTGAW